MESNLKCVLEDAEAIEQAVLAQMIKVGPAWQCITCMWETNHKTRMYEHVEAKHVETNGYTCPFCDKICQSKNALKCHRYKYHRYLQVWILNDNFFADNKELSLG